MFTWGEKSKGQLRTVKGALAGLFSDVLELGLIDISIIEGRRTREKQEEYYAAGKSRVTWPHSKHNVLNPGDLAAALDAAPYVNGTVSYDPRHCIFLAGLVMARAKIDGVPVRWGGNWDRDAEPITDQEFQDLVHYELIDI